MVNFSFSFHINVFRFLSVQSTVSPLTRNVFEKNASHPKKIQKFPSKRRKNVRLIKIFWLIGLINRLIRTFD